MDISLVNFAGSMHWMKFLQHEKDVNLEDLLRAPLIMPIGDFFSHPGKSIRSRLVQMGYHLALENEADQMPSCEEKLKNASSIIEAIHGGALIVDDIQDGSVVRRNEPTMHLKYGLPKALNAGNWLYFWALEQIKHLSLGPQQKDALYESCLSLLSRAHLGQALDVGTLIDEIPQEKVYETCLAAMELKTGTLMSLALILGGSIAGATPQKLSELEELGSRLGIVLQMFDDLGNFYALKGSSQKRMEDLKLKRPTWVWAQVSRLNPISYKQFLTSVQALPDEILLEEWIEREDFRSKCFEGPLQLMKQIISDGERIYSSTHPLSLKMLTEMGKTLEDSYVKKN